METIYILMYMTYTLMFAYYLWMSVKEWKKNKSEMDATVADDNTAVEGGITDGIAARGEADTNAADAVKVKLLMKVMILTMLLVMLDGH